MSDYQNISNTTKSRIRHYLLFVAEMDKDDAELFCNTSTPLTESYTMTANIA